MEKFDMVASGSDAIDLARWRQLDSLLLDDPCEVFPEQVRRSSKGRPWKGLLVWHQMGGQGDLYVPATRGHSVILRRSTATEVLQRQGAVTEKAWIQPGDSIVVPSEVPSFWRSSVSRDYIHMNLDPSWLQRAVGRDIRLKSCFGKPDPVIAGFAHVLMASLDNNSSMVPAFSDAIAMGMALHLAENYAESVRDSGHLAALSYREMRAVAEAIEADLGEDWSVVRLAELLDLSPFHFARAFKRSFGTTPHAYVTAQRMARAARRIRHTRASLADIAAETGYASPSYFSQTFRRFWGVTPTAYRKNA